LNQIADALKTPGVRLSGTWYKAHPLTYARKGYAALRAAAETAGLIVTE